MDVKEYQVVLKIHTHAKNEKEAERYAHEALCILLFEWAADGQVPEATKNCRLEYQPYITDVVPRWYGVTSTLRILWWRMKKCIG